LRAAEVLFKTDRFWGADDWTGSTVITDIVAESNTAFTNRICAVGLQIMTDAFGGDVPFKPGIG
jgi:hypothetical protein